MKNTIIKLVSGVGLLLTPEATLTETNLKKENIPVDNYQLVYYDNDRFTQFANLLLKESDENAVTNKVYINDEVFKQKQQEEYYRIQLENAKKLEDDRLAELERQKQVKLAEERKKQEELNKQREVIKNKQAESSNWMTFNGSYYGSDCYKCSGITATGIDVRNTIYHQGYRIIALDKKIIPLWTIVEVKTPNETFKAIVADTGGRIKGYKADILVESEEVSKKYGRHNIQIRVIGNYK